MWILEHCIWEDIGIWVDTDFWCDGPSSHGWEMFVVEGPDGVNIIAYTSNPPTVETDASKFKYGRKVILPNRW